MSHAFGPLSSIKVALEIGCFPCPTYTLEVPHRGQGQLKPQRARYGKLLGRPFA